jgi:hypothetical protein
MANFIYVHCRSAAKIPYGEIVQLISDGFESPPRFAPPCEGDAATDADWSSFEVYWHPERRPLFVERITSADLLKELAEETAEKFEDFEIVDDHQFVARVRDARQTFHFEFGELTDVAWEMLDDLEMHLASRLDGVVESVEGFYDEDLNPLVSWEPISPPA